MEKLKEAVWQTWLGQVRGGMGCGTPTEMVKEYGFTGPFAGLDKHFKHPLEIAEALENVRDDGSAKYGEDWAEYRRGVLGWN
jgi:hypothetical protein